MKFLAALLFILSFKAQTIAAAENPPQEALQPINGPRGKLAVLSYNTNSVTFIDTRDLRIIKTIYVGEAPIHAVLSHDGKYLYVVNFHSNFVSVIDMDTIEKLQKVIHVGSRPKYAILSRDDTRLYIVNTDSHSISVVDTKTKTKITNDIRVGRIPNIAALSHDGSHLYIPSGLSNSPVSVIDTRVLTRLKDIPLSSVPMDIVLDRDHALSNDRARLYVINPPERDQPRNSISVIDTQTKQILGKVIVGDDPMQPLLSPDNKSLYVLNTEAGSVSFIDTQTMKKNRNDIPVGVPCHAALSQKGNFLYITNCQSNSVSTIKTQTWEKVGEDIPVEGLPSFALFIPDKSFAGNVEEDPLLRAILARQTQSQGQHALLSFTDLENIQQKLIALAADSPVKDNEDFIVLQKVTDNAFATLQNLPQDQRSDISIRCLQAFFDGLQQLPTIINRAEVSNTLEEELNQKIEEMIQHLRAHNHNALPTVQELMNQVHTHFLGNFDAAQRARAQYVVLSAVENRYKNTPKMLSRIQQERLKLLCFIQGAYLGQDIPLEEVVLQEKYVNPTPTGSENIEPAASTASVSTKIAELKRLVNFSNN